MPSFLLTSSNAFNVKIWLSNDERPRPSTGAASIPTYAFGPAWASFRAPPMWLPNGALPLFSAHNFWMAG